MFYFTGRSLKRMQNSTEKQGLEGFFLNAGFERNIVRDSGKRKILDGIRDLTAPREVVTPKSWHGMRYWVRKRYSG